MNRFYSKLMGPLACALVTCLPFQTARAQISPVPLFLGGAVEPNIMLTLDDSGSMQWEVTEEFVDLKRNWLQYKAEHGIQ